MSVSKTILMSRSAVGSQATRGNRLFPSSPVQTTRRLWLASTFAAPRRGESWIAERGRGRPPAGDVRSPSRDQHKVVFNFMFPFVVGVPPAHRRDGFRFRRTGVLALTKSFHVVKIPSSRSC